MSAPSSITSKKTNKTLEICFFSQRKSTIYVKKTKCGNSDEDGDCPVKMDNSSLWQRIMMSFYWPRVFFLLLTQVKKLCWFFYGPIFPLEKAGNAPGDVTASFTCFMPSTSGSDGLADANSFVCCSNVAKSSERTLHVTSRWLPAAARSLIWIFQLMNDFPKIASRKTHTCVG